MEKILDIIKSETVSEINRDIAQVFFAGVVVEPIISNSANITLFLTGIILSIGFWTASIYLNNKNII